MPTILEQAQQVLEQISTTHPPTNADNLLTDTNSSPIGSPMPTTPVAQSGKPPYPPYYDIAQKLMVNQLEQDSNHLPDPTPTDEPLLPFEKWEALAYDLALDYVDRHTLAGEYDISDETLQKLLENQYFVKMYHAKQEEVKSLGSDASFTVKMRMIANRAMPQFLTRLTQSTTTDRDFHNLFRTAIELAQLAPQETEPTHPQMVGANITFNLGGVPGLEHLLMTTDQPSQTQTPLTPPTTLADITDAQVLSDDTNQLPQPQLQLAEL